LVLGLDYDLENILGLLVQARLMGRFASGKQWLLVRQVGWSENNRARSSELAVR